MENGTVKRTRNQMCSVAIKMMISKWQKFVVMAVLTTQLFIACEKCWLTTGKYLYYINQYTVTPGTPVVVY